MAIRSRAFMPRESWWVESSTSTIRAERPSRTARYSGASPGATRQRPPYRRVGRRESQARRSYARLALQTRQEVGLGGVSGRPAAGDLGEDRPGPAAPPGGAPGAG